MLEVIGAGNPEYKGQDWGDVWASSPEAKNLSTELEDIIRARHDVEKKETGDDREYAMPLHVQIVAVTKRTFVAYWRLPDYILVSSAWIWIIHILTFNQGQIHAAHLHWSFQHLYILAPWQQLYRYAVETLLCLYDTHHLTATDSAATATLPACAGPL